MIHEDYIQYMTDKMMNLSKEQLIWLLLQNDHSNTLISETLVEESKWHTNPEIALENIRKYLRENFAFGINWGEDPENIKAELDFKMEKITREECRRRLGLDTNVGREVKVEDICTGIGQECD